MELEIEKAITDFTTWSRELKVVDQKSLILASDIGLAGKRLVIRIKEYFKPLKKKVQESLETLRSMEAEALQKVEPTIKHVDEEATRYLAEERRKRLEAEEAARRNEAERKRLEEETLRLAQEKENAAKREQEEAERKAKEAETKAAAEHDEAKRRKAEEEAMQIRRDMELQKRESERKAREETDRILAEGAAQEKKLDPIPVVPEKVRVQGQALRDNWSVDVFDLYALIIGVAEGRASVSTIQANRVYLNAQAEKLHDKLDIPGVRAVNKPSMMKTRG